jgi:adhesin/invasin
MAVATRGGRHTARRLTDRGRKVKAGAALSSGLLGAALFAGGAPLALAANNGADTVNAPSNSTASQAPTGVGQAVVACFGVGKTITETVSPATITADGTSTSMATATVHDTSTPPNLCKSQQVVFTSSDSKEVVSRTTDEGDGTYIATITSSMTAGQATIAAQLTVLNTSGTGPPTRFVDATATPAQQAGAAVSVAAPVPVPATGASVGRPATVGFGLVALGLGLLARARRVGDRRRRLRILER